METLKILIGKQKERTMIKHALNAFCGKAQKAAE
jgi:hypothetical protein